VLCTKVQVDVLETGGVGIMLWQGHKTPEMYFVQGCSRGPRHYAYEARTSCAPASLSR
jgi:hypothetical protein